MRSTTDLGAPEALSKIMARFFFHIISGREHQWDLQGEVFTTAEAAAAEGRRVANELCEKRLPCETLWGSLHVTDKDGFEVAVFALWDARPRKSHSHLVH